MPNDHHPSLADSRSPQPTPAEASMRSDLDSRNDGFAFDPQHLVLVSIRWKDAESQGGPTWEDSEDMLEFARRPLTTVQTVGVLLHMDDEQIAVTDTVALDQMGGVTKIPRGWIERIERLEGVGSELFEQQSTDPIEPMPRCVG